MSNGTKQLGSNSHFDNLAALAELTNPGSTTCDWKVVLMDNQFLTVIYSPIANQLSTFKKDGIKLISCSSGVFLAAINQIRIDGHKFPLIVNKYEMLDKDVEQLMKTLDKYIRSASIEDAKPDKRRERLLEHIEEHARKWNQ